MNSSSFKNTSRGFVLGRCNWRKELEFGADGEAGEPNLIIKDRKRARQELEALLKHELIHYELKDKGKFFHGHGRAFLKRAQALGIVNSYVLERCFSSEEIEHTPTVRKSRKVPLGKFTRQVDQWFSQLIGEAVKLPEPYGSRLYPHVQNAYVGWLTYSAAVRGRNPTMSFRKSGRSREEHAARTCTNCKENTSSCRLDVQG